MNAQEYLAKAAELRNRRGAGEYENTLAEQMEVFAEMLEGNYESEKVTTYIDKVRNARINRRAAKNTTK